MISQIAHLCVLAVFYVHNKPTDNHLFLNLYPVASLIGISLMCQGCTYAHSDNMWVSVHVVCMVMDNGP